MNWEHFRALLWLRWRLTRNRMSRAGPLNAVVAAIMLGFLLLGAVGMGVGGVLAGALALADLKPPMLLLCWDVVLGVFLMIWLAGLMVELQRSETIDLAKLMHLPITLRQVFVLNYVASHFTPSTALFLPAVLGLCAGLTYGGGLRMALLLPLVLSFFFLVTAWTYCLRGWLSALMVNKRRRRAIIVWITLVLVLAGQTPNLLINSPYFRHRAARSARASAQMPPAPGPNGHGPHAGKAAPQSPAPTEDSGLPPGFVMAHLVLPPGWVGYGAMALKQGNPWPTVGGVAAAALLAGLGLLRAYRMTLRFYQGAEEKAKAGRARPVRVAGRAGQLLVERGLPWLPDDTAGLALATFQSLLRSPELKMALIMPIVMVAAFGSLRFTHAKGALPVYLGPFAGTAAAAIAAFSLVNIMSNMFGLDRNGFRALVLLPTRRHHILFAKNLAFFPLAGLIALAMLLLARFLVALPWTSLLAGLVQIPLAFLLFCLPFNLVSILVPYRLALGSLQARKVKPMVFVGVFITMASLPLVLLPLLVAPGLQALFTFMEWAPWLPLNLLASVAMLAVVAVVYRFLLPLEGRLLQRRELVILREVTEEVE